MYLFINSVFKGLFKELKPADCGKLGYNTTSANFGI